MMRRAAVNFNGHRMNARLVYSMTIRGKRNWQVQAYVDALTRREPAARPGFALAAALMILLAVLA